MASIPRIKADIAEFSSSRPMGQKKTIRLGKVSQRTAEGFKYRVEQLLERAKFKHPIEADLAQWVVNLDPTISSKLVAVGGSTHAMKMQKPTGRREEFPTLFPIADVLGGLLPAGHDDHAPAAIRIDSAKKTGFGDVRGVLALSGQEESKAPRACRSSIFISSNAGRWCLRSYNDRE